MVRYVLQNQLFHAPGIAFGEILNHNLGPGAGNHPNGGEKQSIVNLHPRYIRVEYEVIGAANQLANAERNPFVIENNFVVPNGVFKTTAAEFFHNI